jgi:hypothetical protein
MCVCVCVRALCVRCACVCVDDRQICPNHWLPDFISISPVKNFSCTICIISVAYCCIFCVLFSSETQHRFYLWIKLLMILLYEIKQTYDLYLYVLSRPSSGVNLNYEDWVSGLDTQFTWHCLQFLIKILTVALSPNHNYSLQHYRYYTQSVCSSLYKHRESSRYAVPHQFPGIGFQRRTFPILGFQIVPVQQQHELTNSIYNCLLLLPGALSNQ